MKIFSVSQSFSGTGTARGRARSLRRRQARALPAPQARTVCRLPDRLQLFCRSSQRLRSRYSPFCRASPRKACRALPSARRSSRSHCRRRAFSVRSKCRPGAADAAGQIRPAGAHRLPEFAWLLTASAAALPRPRIPETGPATARRRQNRRARPRTPACALPRLPRVVGGVFAYLHAPAAQQILFSTAWRRQTCERRSENRAPRR